MAEKIHPSSKQQQTPLPTVNPNPNPNPNFPANKAQLYNSARPVYRPLPRRNRRSCCCSLCLWLTFIFIFLILIAAVAGGVFYVLYRPHRPSFTVTSLQINQFNLTSSDKLTTKFNFTVTARNPNKKIEFYYDAVSVNFESKSVNVGNGVIAAFVMPKKNTTKLKSTVALTGGSVGDGELKTDLKNKKKIELVVRLDTKVKVKIGSLKTKKVPIRVVCKGLTASVPSSGKTAPTTASTSNVKCKVDIRVKIWKWTI